MPDENPYSNPYQQADAMPTPSSPGAADAAASQAGAFAAQHRASIGGREKEIRDIQEKQALNVAQMTQMLDDTVAQIKRAREGRSNLPLIEMGAGMMTSTGNFGQQVGAGLQGLARGIKAQREEDTGSETKLAELGLRRAAIANAPLEQRLAYMKALQTGDIAALARIEAMQVKAQAGGTDPAIVKEWKEWQKAPGNEGKPLSDYQTFKAKLTDRGTADQRGYAMWLEDPKNAGKSIEDYKRSMALAGAAGRSEGEDQGKSRAGLGQAEFGLEKLDQTINEMLKHPGMDNAVGRMWANAPAIPGSSKADFLAKEEALKGQVFLKAFDALRGAGAITEAEGLKATVSELPTSRAQSKEAYIANLERYRQQLAQAREILRKRAGAPATVINPAGTALPAEGPGSPSPPGQTGQTPAPAKPQAAPRARMPDGSTVILKNGKWVPE